MLKFHRWARDGALDGPYPASIKTNAFQVTKLETKWLGVMIMIMMRMRMMMIMMVMIIKNNENEKNDNDDGTIS